MAAGVIAECQKNSWNVAVAVVDTHGALVYFERMDNTQIASLEIAIGKAKSLTLNLGGLRFFKCSVLTQATSTSVVPVLWRNKQSDTTLWPPARMRYEGFNCPISERFYRSRSQRQLALSTGVADFQDKSPIRLKVSPIREA
jgi:hypothetical protein